MKVAVRENGDRADGSGKFTINIRWCLEVEFEYNVAGKKYLGNQYFLNGNPCSMSSKQIYKFSSELELGQNIQVFYSRENPINSALKYENM